MSERETFEGQIRENPDDDTVRLVFADWLQENGDADYAEFVRVQIELAKSAEKIGTQFVKDTRPVGSRRDHIAVRDEDPHVEKLRRREMELFRNLTKVNAPGAWRAFAGLPIAGGTHQDGKCLVSVYGATPYTALGTIRRGFLEAVELPCEVFCGLTGRDGTTAALFRHPVRLVTLSDRTPDETFDAPHFSLWHRAVEPDELDDAPSLLPAELFDLLQPSLPSAYPGEEWVGEDEEAALLALCEACLKYGYAVFESQRGR